MIFFISIILISGLSLRYLSTPLLILILTFLISLLIARCPKIKDLKPFLTPLIFPRRTSRYLHFFTLKFLQSLNIWYLHVIPLSSPLFGSHNYFQKLYYIYNIPLHFSKILRNLNFLSFFLLMNGLYSNQYN